MFVSVMHNLKIRISDIVSKVNNPRNKPEILIGNKVYLFANSRVFVPKSHCFSVFTLNYDFVIGLFKEQRSNSELYARLRRRFIISINIAWVDLNSPQIYRRNIDGRILRHNRIGINENLRLFAFYNNADTFRMDF